MIMQILKNQIYFMGLFLILNNNTSTSTNNNSCNPIIATEQDTLTLFKNKTHEALLKPEEEKKIQNLLVAYCSLKNTPIFRDYREGKSVIVLHEISPAFSIVKNIYILNKLSENHPVRKKFLNDVRKLQEDMIASKKYLEKVIENSPLTKSYAHSIDKKLTKYQTSMENFLQQEDTTNEISKELLELFNGVKDNIAQVYTLATKENGPLTLLTDDNTAIKFLAKAQELILDSIFYLDFPYAKQDLQYILQTELNEYMGHFIYKKTKETQDTNMEAKKFLDKLHNMANSSPRGVKIRDVPAIIKRELDNVYKEIDSPANSSNILALKDKRDNLLKILPQQWLDMAPAL